MVELAAGAGDTTDGEGMVEGPGPLLVLPEVEAGAGGGGGGCMARTTPMMVETGTLIWNSP